MKQTNQSERERKVTWIEKKYNENKKKLGFLVNVGVDTNYHNLIFHQVFGLKIELFLDLWTFKVTANLFFLGFFKTVFHFFFNEWYYILRSTSLLASVPGEIIFFWNYLLRVLGTAFFGSNISRNFYDSCLFNCKFI